MRSVWSLSWTPQARGYAADNCVLNNELTSEAVIIVFKRKAFARMFRLRLHVWKFTSVLVFLSLKLQKWWFETWLGLQFRDFQWPILISKSWDFSKRWGVCIYDYIIQNKKNKRILCLILCLTEEINSYRFGTFWGWVNRDRIFIFGWTNPLRTALNRKLSCMCLIH